MKIVIDIDDDMYKSVVNNDAYVLEDVDWILLENAIANGKPLPEHHGRLGDLDALEEYFKDVRKQLKASDYKDGTEFFVRDEMLLNFQQFIHLCDTIIEESESE